MKPDISGPWRRTDSRLVIQSIFSFLLIFSLAAFALNLSYRQRSNSSSNQILGSETQPNTPSVSPDTLPATPSAFPSHGQ